MGLSEVPSVSTIDEGEAEHVKTGATSPLALVDEIQVIIPYDKIIVFREQEVPLQTTLVPSYTV